MQNYQCYWSIFFFLQSEKPILKFKRHTLDNIYYGNWLKILCDHFEDRWIKKKNVSYNIAGAGTDS